MPKAKRCRARKLKYRLKFERLRFSACKITLLEKEITPAEIKISRHGQAVDAFGHLDVTWTELKSRGRGIILRLV